MGFTAINAPKFARQKSIPSPTSTPSIALNAPPTISTTSPVLHAGKTPQSDAVNGYIRETTTHSTAGSTRQTKEPTPKKTEVNATRVTGQTDSTTIEQYPLPATQVVTPQPTPNATVETRDSAPYEPIRTALPLSTKNAPNSKTSEQLPPQALQCPLPPPGCENSLPSLGYQNTPLPRQTLQNTNKPPPSITQPASESHDYKCPTQLKAPTNSPLLKQNQKFISTQTNVTPVKVPKPPSIQPERTERLPSNIPALSNSELNCQARSDLPTVEASPLKPISNTPPSIAALPRPLSTSKPKASARTGRDSTSTVSGKESHNTNQQRHPYYTFSYPQVKSEPNFLQGFKSVLQKGDYKEPEPRVHAFGITEVPTLRPTPKEFKDPASYIAKIQHIGKKYGMVKVIPPSSWDPPFSLDTDVSSATSLSIPSL